MDTIVLERFFDEAGGMQLVGHAPFGARVNRALGLALRKRFCVTFDFELQAAASDDAILLSLGPQHSFPLDRVPHFLASATVEDVVRQAVLTSPLFQARWRWNLNRSLAVLRMRGGKKNPPAIQRMESDDLMAAVFPTLAACQENVAPGPLEIPDHPLVRQTLHDCLHEAMDIDGLRELLHGIETGQVKVEVRDTTEPSVLAHEILNGQPFTFLDDAPLEERRSRAVPLPRGLPVEARELGRLDPAAIERVIAQVRPDPRDPDELHDLLMTVLAHRPEPDWQDMFARLAGAARAVTVESPAGPLWCAVERRPAVEALFPGAPVRPDHPCPVPAGEVEEDVAAADMLRGHLEYRRPVHRGHAERRDRAARRPGADRAGPAGGRGLRGPRQVHRAGCAGGVLRPAAAGPGARLHPAAAAPGDRAGQRPGLHAVPAPLAARGPGHPARGPVRRDQRGRAAAGLRAGRRGLGEPRAGRPGDRLPPRTGWMTCASPGRSAGAGCRCATPGRSRSRQRASPRVKRSGLAPSRATPITLTIRDDLPWLLRVARGDLCPAEPGPGRTADVLDALRQHGALFRPDLATRTGRLPSEVDEALWDGVARGLITADGFRAVRSLLRSRSRPSYPQRRGLRGGLRRVRAPAPARPGAGRCCPSRCPRATRTSWPRRPPSSCWCAGAWCSATWSAGRTWPCRGGRSSGRFRRMEARGTIRGGRFVTGFSGEQFAHPDAVDVLREVRKQRLAGETVQLSAADPLNLTGIILPGPRVPAIHANTVTYTDGAVPNVPNEQVSEPA